MRYFEIYYTSNVVMLIAESHSSLLWDSAIRSNNHNVNICHNLALKM
jgi:hypothetical protein